MRKPGLDLTNMYLAQSYADVGLDVLIISLPIPLIWSQMCLSRGKKIGVSFVFLLGSLTTGASIARTVVQYGVVQECKFAVQLPVLPGITLEYTDESRNPDRTYFLTPIIYWPLIEASLGIVAACLPLLRPVLLPVKSAILRSKRSLRTLIGSSEKSKTDNPSSQTNLSQPQLPNAMGAKPTQRDRWLRAYHMSYVTFPIAANVG
jgi:hypothetical protein